MILSDIFDHHWLLWSHVYKIIDSLRDMDPMRVWKVTRRIKTLRTSGEYTNYIKGGGQWWEQVREAVKNTVKGWGVPPYKWVFLANYTIFGTVFGNLLIYHLEVKCKALAFS